MRRFFVPWLAYTALNGLGGSVICGMLVTLGGLIAAIFALISGASGGQLWRAFESIILAFPVFVLFVLLTCVYGFVGGFLSGILTALIGDVAGLVWSLVSIFALVFLAAALYPESLNYPSPSLYSCNVPDYRTDIRSPLVILFVSSFGAVLTADLLSSDTPRIAWDASIRRWLRNSWLVSPSQSTRLLAVLLPLVFCLLMVVNRIR